MTLSPTIDRAAIAPTGFEVEPGSVGERLAGLGVSRRGFLRFCTTLASSLALEAGMGPQLAHALTTARPSIVYMSFQECTGCLESLVNSYGVTIENLILQAFSIDYLETLQAAAGARAEAAREAAMAANAGKYVLVVDGSIPKNPNGGFFVSAGESAVQRLKHAADRAAFVVAVGTCAAYGGLAHARPNPTGAVSVSDILPNKTVINVPGCPPIAEVITGVLAYWLAKKTLPALDSLKRPKLYYGHTVHSECYREETFEDGPRTKSFGDVRARAGNCLFDLGCKGPVTHNACSTLRWNQGTSFPIQSGHGCIGCAEPDFWDMGGLYARLPPGSFDD